VPAALAGLDEEEFLSRFFSQPLKDAVLAGEVPMSRLDDMVARKLRGLIAVSVYDDPPDGPGSIDVAAGARVAERLARRSMVLLKNRRRRCRGRATCRPCSRPGIPAARAPPRSRTCCSATRTRPAS
jgi:beta-glucosidase-like glycosyl hydrolase